MPFIKLCFVYLLTGIAFLVIDGLWLGWIASDFYQKYLGYLMGPIKWPAAALFYLIYVAGILVFSVIPGYMKSSLSYTLVYGALFGFFTYATYDLTNLATLKDWPLRVVVVDVIWGVVLCTVVSFVGYYSCKWVGG